MNQPFLRLVKYPVSSSKVWSVRLTATSPSTTFSINILSPSVVKRRVFVQVLKKVPWISELLFREMLLGVQNIISLFNWVEFAFQHIIYGKISRFIIANCSYIYENKNQSSNFTKQIKKCYSKIFYDCFFLSQFQLIY